MGKYAESIAAAEKALGLDEGRNKSLQTKLQNRIAQAQLHLMHISALRLPLLPLPDDGLPSSMTDNRECMGSLRLKLPRPKLRELLARELPRCKPPFTRIPAWGRFGHDTFQPLFDNQLGKVYNLSADPKFTPSSDLNALTKTSTEVVSFFFGGIGDARHLFATWVELYPALNSSPPAEGLPRFDFLVNDYDPHVFARDLSIWYLLDTLAAVIADGRASKDGLMLTTTIYYVFCSPIMPPEIYDYLQTTITECVEMLQDKRPLPCWLVFLEQTRETIISVFETWQNEIPRLYDVSAFHKSMLKHQVEHGSLLMAYDASLVQNQKKSMKIEQDCYTKTLLLLPPKILQDAHLDRLYRQFVKNTKDSKELRRNISSTWKVDPTLFDLNDEKLRDNVSEMYPEPWRLLEDLYVVTMAPLPEDPKSLFEYVAPFFMVVAQILASLRDRMTVRVSVGDVVDQLEDLRPSMQSEPAERTQGLFDRIHLSNKPDYLGMDFFTFQYAVPLLKTHDAAFVTFNCLTCLPRWKTLAQYNVEGVLLHKPDDLARSLDVAFAGFWEDSLGMKIDGGSYDSCDGFKYFRWRRAASSRTFEDLLSRSDFNHWIHSIFLQIALPAIRSHDKDQYRVAAWVWKPTNLTAFLRLLSHLQGLNYPSHWLGQVLSNILSDNVTTSARPADRSPMSPGDASKRWPAKKVSTAPLTAELSTLTAQFRDVLPFAVTVGPGVIPEVQSIRECTVCWTSEFVPPIELMDAHRDDWILVFCNMDIYVEEQHKYPDMQDVKKLRQTLTHPKLSEEVKGAVHLVTTWKWNRERREARFWLREDVVERIMNEKEQYGWRVELWRTDTWWPLSLSRPFYADVEWTLGRRWSDMVSRECS
ncbi:hypothetical protein H2200_006630 [Cladophialophora chaetospira]|uniref:DUF4470 domain-containing protein n=1 Tax=Cladophialophora chaetospira TaxID=386627 RepID=A0AA38X959_9EURO|nr:hypothetical protein H2200_006630 [Cladophialophora chaetospira]